MPTHKAVDIPRTELLEHVKDGKTDREIASLYYCSESTINRIRKDYGIARYIRVYDKPMYQRMKELGLTDEQVCHIWACGRRDLNKWKHRAGLSKHRNSF